MNGMLGVAVCSTCAGGEASAGQQPETITLRMASDLRKMLDCSICLTIYTDPVTMRCGHTFCELCIDQVLYIQEMEESGVFTCPECKEVLEAWPVLQRNITLCDIVESFHSAQEETGVFCTYCIHSPVPAVMSCLMCEASLCDNHLRVHSKSPEHVLCDPTTSLENRKCSVHKKILEYYCLADAACICVSCRLDGDHQGHKVETLDEASKKKKQKLRNNLQELITKREETEKEVQSLQENKRKVHEKSSGVTERVTALFRDLRRQLDDLEKRVLRGVSRQEEKLSLPLSVYIQQLEIKKAELSRKMRHIEELCNMTDPLTVLQESHTGDLCDTEEGDKEDRERHDGRDLDVALISHTLYTGLSDIIAGVTGGSIIQEATDILLDINTAHNKLHISDDMKIVCRSDISQNRPETPERFQTYPQVISSQSFSSGRHYWEVDVSKSEWFSVGMCYPSVNRRGDQSLTGHNKAWCLLNYKNKFFVVHDCKWILLPDIVSSNRVGIYLDYEAGRLSFYDLCVPIRHLHTFTATFTEPLHAALCVVEGCINICNRRGKQEHRHRARGCRGGKRKQARALERHKQGRGNLITVSLVRNVVGAVATCHGAAPAGTTSILHPLSILQ
ncbi:E3 ubiquitin-protein ligase TRIM11-like [Hyperolius riggenbachi]|uniref:E3 ubiquitin-protein ligase TRIM11-like n=1 Tax=Hyperolius riggenbachi TaxID=752182 RepID=UPI0035A31668